MTRERQWLRRHDNGWESWVRSADHGYTAGASRPNRTGPETSSPRVEYPVYRSFLSAEYAKTGADAELRRRSDHPHCTDGCQSWSRGPETSMSHGPGLG